jgi:FtsP/CotA-like multicopper oxidase with cupredoxin domain
MSHHKVESPLLVVCFAIIFSAAAGRVSRADDAASGFANPPMLSSRDGQLHVDLTAALATYTINGHQFQGMLYNGSYMPSVWRLHAGDSLTVTLHNHLNEPTNLHFHGLDVSPLGNGDNVFLHIQPGSDFTYDHMLSSLFRSASIISSLHCRKSASGRFYRRGLRLTPPRWRRGCSGRG